MDYRNDIEKYIPVNEQEAKDLEVLKRFITDFPNDSLLRSNDYGHLSSSAWIVNKDMTKVLMNYHNIYKNWGWLGGHADGDSDLLHVAIKEAHEESGLANITPVVDYPISVEILPVPYHIKKGKFVNSHLHFNLTYLLCADETEELHIKPDENSGLKWVNLDEAPIITNEEAMKPIYTKLNKKVKELANR